MSEKTKPMDEQEFRKGIVKISTIQYLTKFYENKIKSLEYLTIDGLFDEVQYIYDVTKAAKKYQKQMLDSIKEIQDHVIMSILYIDEGKLISEYSKVIDLGEVPSEYLKAMHYVTTLERIRDKYDVILTAPKGIEYCTKYTVTKEALSYKEQKDIIDSYVEEAERFMKEFWDNE